MNITIHRFCLSPVINDGKSSFITTEIEYLSEDLDSIEEKHILPVKDEKGEVIVDELVSHGLITTYRNEGRCQTLLSNVRGERCLH
ncbi:Uncharacterised protein [Klebsiella pneumoniae]|nr:Uncharacterised protein [Klebsiella pneumoniae]SYM82732.1 Uncharacterised protein [Klebsiella pneumoniae]